MQRMVEDHHECNTAVNALSLSLTHFRILRFSLSVFHHHEKLLLFKFSNLIFDSL